MTSALSSGRPRTRVHAAAARTFRVVAICIALAIGGDTTLFACPQCFGAEETTVMAGTRLGVLVMLGITVLVQGAFLGFFIYLRRRAKRMASLELDDEWSELQRSPRTS